MDVVTIGETMILLSTNTRLRYANNFSMGIGGAESNVAIGLARLNHKVGWISRLGNDEFGKYILSVIRGEGVDISKVQFDNQAPTGIYFKELRKPNDVRIQYYRKGSAASKMDKNDLDKNYIKRATYLHITGITPALSDNCYKMILEAISIAKLHGVSVVFDPNLRKQLWKEDRAKKILLEIALQSDIFLPGLNEGKFLTGYENPKDICEYFKNLGVSTVVVKAGKDGAYLMCDKVFKHIKGIKVDDEVDPVGAGDGFAAGFLSGLIDKLSTEEAVKRGNVIGAFVITQHGDVEGLPDKQEIHDFLSDKEEDVRR
ncbi:2-dehydro-3-deoxygluconokinase [Oceanobacillus oncorhynchi subsp. incaldanensis]|uniref:sugar kinase n=1 Tax=Oceanobacillus oncorhynchi TaxID=545501 RepID=UPI001B083683|nr:sugar kinase [Oceanobacillus oncorhynchi]GIO20238.1 2-dehydro-3-deoxygluconokinase [Oceanobacillus oncorhynchi subsp. incaldanensis]